jgi:hypothetical protein
VTAPQFDPFIQCAPWQAAFPEPFTISHFVWTGMPDVVDPNTGNMLETWADPVPFKAQGWDILGEVKLAGMQREILYNMFLMVGPDRWPNVRDRFGFPLPQNQFVIPSTMFTDGDAVQQGIFEVVGYDIEQYGMNNWTPGNIILCKDCA